MHRHARELPPLTFLFGRSFGRTLDRLRRAKRDTAMTLLFSICLVCLSVLLHFQPSVSFISHVVLKSHRNPSRICTKMTTTTSDDVDDTTSPLFRVRTVTIFISLRPSMFPMETTPSVELSQLVTQCAQIVKRVEAELTNGGYEVQTVRFATNPFGEWLYDATGTMKDTAEFRLDLLTSLLEEHSVQFCSLGPAQNVQETLTLCGMIVKRAPCYSCSANIDTVESATAAAQCILDLSKDTHGGLGNFRFCAAASCQPFIPFFPAAKSSSQQRNDGIVGFALGLENGALAKSLLQECKTIANIDTVFRDGMAAAVMPLQAICESLSKDVLCPYLGMDTSLNPSLDQGGSVAEAIETLDEVQGDFGGRGTLAAAAAITTALQSLPDIKLTGYCGLMLPVCEDTRLAHLASEGKLKIVDILSISSVCGVGIDTVPIPGDCEESLLASLILDVAGVANRWNKSLSCRVFPVPNRKVGKTTNFDSPYLCNSRVLPL